MNFETTARPRGFYPSNLSGSPDVAKFLEPGDGLGDFWIAESGCADEVLTWRHQMCGSKSFPRQDTSAAQGQNGSLRRFAQFIVREIQGIESNPSNSRVAR